MPNHNTRYKVLLPILVVFGLVYASIALVNHYNFRTSAFDLGMFNHAVYSFSRFHSNIFTLDILNRGINYFADHFSPITFLYVPFYWVFGSYGLLILQILAVLAGGLGLFRYMQNHTTQVALPYIILVQFFCIWGIYTAVSFDFHNNVIAAMMLPWLIYLLDKEKLKQAALLIFLMLMTKENTGLWVAFVLAGMALRKQAFLLKKHTAFMIGVALFCAAYTFFVVDWLTPLLNQENKDGFQLTRYAQYGNNLPEIAMYLLSHPSALKEIMIGPPDSLEYSIKMELYQAFLLSGGVAIIVRPYLLIWLIPVFAAKLLSKDFAFWGVSHHYSIEFVPILAFAVFEAINQFRGKIVQVTFAVVFVVLTCFTTIALIDLSVIPMNKVNLRFYAGEHYRSGLNIKGVHEAIQHIPPGEPVSVHTNLAPHMVEREKLYHFPVVNEARYIILFETKRGSYPFPPDEYGDWINMFIKEKKFQVIYRKDDILILKR
ncbi:MAG: DUF2079 domain-containing protein [Bacteroidia bacterium]|jgi:uncharacterized membrane protein